MPLLKYFAGDYCLLVWLVLLSCENNLTLGRVFLGDIFSEGSDQNTWHCLSQKKILFHSTHGVVSLCTGWRLKCTLIWNSEYLITWFYFFIILLYIYIYIYIYICIYIKLYIWRILSAFFCTFMQIPEKSELCPHFNLKVLT